MPRTDLQQIFTESASEVLETMFFTGVVEENSEEDAPAMLAADLEFNGSSSGRFGIRVPVPTARLIAASFLGLDEAEVSEAQAAEVLGELTNMICGSVLSRYETGARFELSHPEIDRNNKDWHEYEGAVGCTLGLEEGTLTLWMAAESAPVCV